MKPRRISPEMQTLVSAPDISRNRTLEVIWAHSKEHNLPIESLFFCCFSSFFPLLCCVPHYEIKSCFWQISVMQMKEQKRSYLENLANKPFRQNLKTKRRRRKRRYARSYSGSALSAYIHCRKQQVLAGVIKAGASRDHEIQAETRDAVFSFTRKMEPRRVSPVECFLEKANTGRSRSSSRSNSPGRSPVCYIDEQIQGFKVNLRPEKKSKFSAVVSKIRGLDQDIAGTLAMEESEDVANVTKLRSVLESVDHKRRKILQQMKNDVAVLMLEDGGTPIQNPSSAVEDARLASLISLDGMLKQVKMGMEDIDGDIIKLGIGVIRQGNQHLAATFNTLSR